MKKHLLPKLFFAVLVWKLTFLTASAWANVHVLPRQFADYPQDRNFVRREVRVRHVPGAILARVNYFALRRDFPMMRDWSNSKIDEWLKTEMSYISEHQGTYNGLRNTDIPYSDEKPAKTGFRQNADGRGDQLEVFDSNGQVVGVISRKGVGLQVPYSGGAEGHLLDLYRDKEYADGLMGPEGMAEDTRMSGLQMLFDLNNKKHGTNYQTVENYAVLVLPFRILRSGGQSFQATIVLRQANIGRLKGFDERHGIYHDYRGGKQSDYFNSAIDGGGIILDARHLVSDPAFQHAMGGSIAEPQDTNSWRWAHDTIEAMVRGENPDHQAGIRHFNEMLAPLIKIWDAEIRPSQQFYVQRKSFKDEVIGYLKQQLRDGTFHEAHRRFVEVAIAENWAGARVEAMEMLPEIFRKANNGQRSEFLSMLLRLRLHRDQIKPYVLIGIQDSDVRIRYRSSEMLNSIQYQEQQEQRNIVRTCEEILN